VVIDLARRFTPVPFPLLGISALLPLPISKFSQRQRKGRVGRKAPGIYHGMYTKEVSNLLSEDEYPSTFVTSDASLDILTIISTDQLSRFLTFSGSMVGVNKLIALHKARQVFPSFDLMNDPNLLINFSFDLTTIAFRTLYRNGFINRSGQLSPSGYQLVSIGAQNLAEAIMRVVLMKEMLHPFDINIIVYMLKDCFRDFEFDEEFDFLRCHIGWHWHIVSL